MANTGRTKSKKAGEQEYTAGDWTATRLQNFSECGTRSAIKAWTHSNNQDKKNPLEDHREPAGKKPPDVGKTAVFYTPIKEAKK